MEKRCSLCKVDVDSDTADIFAVGGFGNPKYICKSCAADVECTALGREYDAIKAAMDRIGEKMAKADITDETVLDAVNDLFTEAKKRAEQIKAGTYDFANDEPEEEESPELLEDAEPEPEEEEKKENKALSVAIDVVLGLVLAGAMTAFILWII